MNSGSARPEPDGKRYRFGFLLNTTIGNQTRYLNLRKYAEHDDEIDFTWAPVSHYTPPDFPSRLRFLPDPIFLRARLLQQAQPVLGKLNELDAVMVHLFEADLLLALRSCWRKGPIHVSSTDEAPVTDRSTYPLYPHELNKPVWRQKLRLALDLWRVKHTDQFIPFSAWVAGVLTRDCGVPASKVHPLHVGLDLDLWHARPHPRTPGPRLKLLFVGADFSRKGGELLLDVFARRFQDSAELHLVTRQAPKALPAHVHVHADFVPNDPRLVELYAEVDVLVIPTTADTGPLWVFMEAMSMGLPIIGTDTGANTELVRHGDTGLVVGIGDGEALATAIRTLADDPALRARMGARGRELIETRYSARVNVPQILRVMKDAVDAKRALGGATRSAAA